MEPDENSEVATVNGWLIEQCGNIPEKGYSFEYENINITVTKADDLITHEICVKINEDALLLDRH